MDVITASRQVEEPDVLVTLRAYTTHDKMGVSRLSDPRAKGINS
jgi:hypothetical protein